MTSSHSSHSKMQLYFQTINQNKFHSVGFLQQQQVPSMVTMVTNQHFLEMPVGVSHNKEVATLYRPN